MKKILLFLILILMFGCDDKTNIEQLMTENEYVIVDVRTEEEYNDLHLAGSINIPYDVINETIDIDKNKIVFVYCRSGNRSKAAYDKLISLGYEVYDLGGIDAIDLPKE